MSLPRSDKNFFVYADDDSDDLEFVISSFATHAKELMPYTFPSCNDAYNFLLQLENRGQKPCLIILDINMPGMSGKELLKTLRSIAFFDDVPIILFTTSNSEEDAIFAHRHDARFLTKPIGLAEMESIAEQFLTFCSEHVKQRIKP